MTDAIDNFLDATVTMLIENRSPEHRDVFVRQVPPANHKSMGVVSFEAPATVDLSTVTEALFREYGEKCFRTAYGSVSSPDYTHPANRNSKRLFHSFVVGSLFVNTAAVTAIAEAGPARWVAMFTSSAKAEKVAEKPLFNDVEARLGLGWKVSNSFAAIDRTTLYPFFASRYSPADVRPDTLGYLSFHAAATGERVGA